MFKKIAGFFVKSSTSEKGILSLIREKTGKISFKRSYAIILLTTIAAPDIAIHGLNWKNIVVLGIGAAVYILPSMVELYKSKHNSSTQG